MTRSSARCPSGWRPTWCCASATWSPRRRSASGSRATTAAGRSSSTPTTPGTSRPGRRTRSCAPIRRCSAQQRPAAANRPAKPGSRTGSRRTAPPAKRSPSSSRRSATSCSSRGSTTCSPICCPRRPRVYVASSMPIRDLGELLPTSPKQLRFLANRGANGIDGLVSSGLGAAATNGDHTFVLTGDVGLYHDMNGLLAMKRNGVEATIVVINNGGGSIFDFLPIAAPPRRLRGAVRHADRPRPRARSRRSTRSASRGSAPTTSLARRCRSRGWSRYRLDRSRNVSCTASCSSGSPRRSPSPRARSRSAPPAAPAA